MKAKLFAAIAGLSVLMTITVDAQERKLTRDQLPGAVAATIDKETKGAEIKGFSTEREHGKKVYEAETTIDGHSRDIQVAADGALMEVEEEVAMDKVPADVQSSLKAKAKDAEITKVESLTKKGVLVAYEAATLRNGKKGEIQVGPNGNKLAREE